MPLSNEEKDAITTYVNAATVQQGEITKATLDLKSKLRTNADATSDASVNEEIAGAKRRVAAAAMAIRALR